MVKISPFGAVPIMNNNKEFVNLTGSASIYEVGGLKILVDLGMFQGSEGADIFNKENVDFIKDVDVVLITHAHIDHIGRLPLLNKLGFEGEIYMSTATKAITYEMLLDSLKIQKTAAIEKKKINKNLGKRLRLSFKILNYIQDLKSDNISSEEKNTRKSFLGKKLGKDYNPDEVCNQIREYLSLYDIRDESDIQGVIDSLDKLLFTDEDLLITLSKIKTIEVGEEKILSSKIKKLENSNVDEMDFLRNLPEEVAKGYTQVLTVNSKRAKRELRKVWETRLEKEIKQVIEDLDDFSDIKNEFIRKLDYYLTYIDQYDFLDLDNQNNKKDINKIHFENISDFKEVRNNIKRFNYELKKYGIKNKGDIERLADNNEKIIELLKYKIPYNRSDIEKASSLIDIRYEDEEREIIGITPVSAAHVVGSVSMQIISGTTKKKINSLMELKGETKSVHFSGDLGRMHDNRLGQPEQPMYPVDYLQIETTYGGRDHLEREQANKNLIQSIEESVGPVLISVFSQQRKQEILLTIIEDLIKKGSKYIDYEILIDAPLAKKLSDIYLYFHGETFNLLCEETQEKIFGKVIFRYLAEGEFEEIHGNHLSTNDFDKLYDFDYKNKKLDLLSDIDKQNLKENIDRVLSNGFVGNNLIFLKEIQEILGKDLYKELIGGMDPDKKIIILSSSGMMDGGAIMNHLPYILSNKNATLLVPGYQSEGTLGYKIVIEKADSVTVNCEKIEVLCNHKFLDGFSSHIGHTEILEYISKGIKQGKYNKGATIALTHGSRAGQYLLQDDLLEILSGLNRDDINIIIPDFGETYDLNDDTFIKQELKVTISDQKQKTVPSFLIEKSDTENQESVKQKNKKQDDKYNNKPSLTRLDKSKQEKIEDFKKIRFSNKLDLESIKSRITDKIKTIKEELKEKTKSLFSIKPNSHLSREFQKLKMLSLYQRKYLTENIDKKFARNRQLGNEINSIKTSIIELERLLAEVYDFITKAHSDYKAMILSLSAKAEELEIQKASIQAEIAEEFISYDKAKKSRLQRELRNVINKIKSIDEEITSINKYESKFKSDSIRLINKNIKNGTSEQLIKLLSQVWKDIDTFDQFKALIKAGIGDLKSEIRLLRGELGSHINIEFIKKEANFGGEDLYQELYDDTSEKVNIELLEQYIQDGLIPGKDVETINNRLLTVKTSNSKIEKQKAGRFIRKYFKEKSNENKDLGIDHELSLSKLEELCNTALKNFFTKEYYENFVAPHFNIYLFLKSKLNFKDFVFSKYDTTKAKKYNDFRKSYDEQLAELGYYQEILTKLELSNESETDLDKLDDISFGIESTKQEIESIIDYI